MSQKKNQQEWRIRRKGIDVMNKEVAQDLLNGLTIIIRKGLLYI